MVQVVYLQQHNSRGNSGKKQRIIFHVDMDSFYASCELAKRPALKKKPFIVGANPNEGRGRGVVLSCNYPAKSQGIRSGMPISKAWQICPSATYVLPNHQLYGEVSKRVMEILKDFFNPKIEQISIDEAYLDFSDDIGVASLSGEERIRAIRAIANAIRRKVSEQEGITCSIGVSNSKLVSKIATDMNKPDGITIVEPADVKEFLAPLPVEKIPGIGRVTQKTLFEYFRVKTISDLAAVPLDLLQDKFGSSGLWFHNVAEGRDESEVITNWEPVSESAETTFEEDESDYGTVRKVMKEVAEDVYKRTVNDGYLFRSIGIKIRLSGFETHTRSRTLSAPADSLEIMLRECDILLSEFRLTGRKKVRLIGVRLFSLEKKVQESQRTLLEWTA